MSAFMSWTDRTSERICRGTCCYGFALDLVTVTAIGVDGGVEGTVTMLRLAGCAGYRDITHAFIGEI